MRSLQSAGDYGYGGPSTVDVDGEELAAVALWRMPDDIAPPGSPLPSVSALLSALVGRTRVETIGQSLGALATVTPTGRFAYLHFVAVRPSLQRRGFGRRVIEPGLAFADGVGPRYPPGVHQRGEPRLLSLTGIRPN